MDPRLWLDEPPVIQQIDRLLVLRDDLLEGGSKLRFLPFLAPGEHELVFGGPFCGGAPLALSVIGREQKRPVTLFYAARKELHARQQAAIANGAKIEWVRPGYMGVVQARAQKYAAEKGAQFLPLGFDVPLATEPFAEFMLELRKKVGDPPQIWCAAGSGMLARNIAKAFPSSEIRAVAVGLKSRHGKQDFPGNVRMERHDFDFARPVRAEAPFPSCPNYDRKAWQMAQRLAAPGSLFWNVLG